MHVQRRLGGPRLQPEERSARVSAMTSELSARRAYVRGLPQGLPICLGYFAVALAFGLVALGSGLTPLIATVISVTNLSGAGQFAGVMVLGSGGGLAELVSTVLVINLRYVLMALALQQRLPAGLSVWQRVAVGFGITDEVFAVAIQPQVPLSVPWFLGLMTLPWLGWSAGTLVGALLGAILPPLIVQALGIALYCMFIAIIVPPALDSRPILVTVLLAAAISVLLAQLPVTRDLAFGWRVIVATVIAASHAAWRWPLPEGTA